VLDRWSSTDSSRWELLVLRLVLSFVMWPHGAQKALGWFGGFGFAGTQSYFVETLGMPWLLGLLVIGIEFVGPVLLALGLATRAVALGFAAIMVGAVTVGGHLQHGFFLDWFGNQAGQGIEYHLLMVAGTVVLVVAGGGPAALDSIVLQRITDRRQDTPESGSATVDVIQGDTGSNRSAV